MISEQLYCRWAVVSAAAGTTEEASLQMLQSPPGWSQWVTWCVNSASPPRTSKITRPERNCANLRRCAFRILKDMQRRLYVKSSDTGGHHGFLPKGGPRSLLRPVNTAMLTDHSE